MHTGILLRHEINSDVDKITEVIRLAFEDHPHSDQSEHILVEKLRKHQALSTSMVAELGGVIVGHIAFSKVTIDGVDQHWHGLAPVSVLPMYQNLGIGSKLVRTGVASIKQHGAKGCVLVGEPDYYHRFGFHRISKLTYPGVSEEYFLALKFKGKLPSGEVSYHAVFSESYG